jgi:hypothetical protein
MDPWTVITGDDSILGMLLPPLRPPALAIPEAPLTAREQVM